MNQLFLPHLLYFHKGHQYLPSCLAKKKEEEILVLVEIRVGNCKPTEHGQRRPLQECAFERRLEGGGEWTVQIPAGSAFRQRERRRRVEACLCLPLEQKVGMLIDHWKRLGPQHGVLFLQCNALHVQRPLGSLQIALRGLGLREPVQTCQCPGPCRARDWPRNLLPGPVKLWPASLLIASKVKFQTLHNSSQCEMV